MQEYVRACFLMYVCLSFAIVVVACSISFRHAELELKESNIVKNTLVSCLSYSSILRGE